MHIKIVDGQPVPYSVGQLRRDNPQVSFPSVMPDSLLAEYGVLSALVTEPPPYTNTETFEDAGFTQLEDGSWAQAWLVRPLNEQELAVITQKKDAQRRVAYEKEADPLFFKWQRGEATQQQWLDKVAEIKATYL